VRQHLAESVVGKGLGSTVRVIDAQYFAVGFAFEPGRLIQRIGDGNQVLAVVVGVVGAFARAILKTLDLRQAVPPQVFGLVRRVDDGVRQAVVAVEVFGLVAEGVGFGDEVALVVVAGSPDAAVWN
jgi:hypothetical protein